MGRSLIGFSGFHSKMEKEGGSSDPLFTARIPPIFSDSIFFFENTSEVNPHSVPLVRMRSARSVAPKL